MHEPSSDSASAVVALAVAVMLVQSPDGVCQLRAFDAACIVGTFPTCQLVSTSFVMTVTFFCPQ